MAICNFKAGDVLCAHKGAFTGYIGVFEGLKDAPDGLAVVLGVKGGTVFPNLKNVRLATEEEKVKLVSESLIK